MYKRQALHNPGRVVPGVESRTRVYACAVFIITTVKKDDLAERACDVLEARSSSGRAVVWLRSPAQHNSAQLTTKLLLIIT